MLIGVSSSKVKAFERYRNLNFSYSCFFYEVPSQIFFNGSRFLVYVKLVEI